MQASLDGVDWQWLVEHKTLKVISGQAIDKKLPATITKYDFNNQIPLRVVPMREEQKQQSSQYYLSWEAMQPNRDQARSDIPAPSTLRVHKITRN